MGCRQSQIYGRQTQIASRLRYNRNIVIACKLLEKENSHG
jgi:hypothetical protein